MCDINGDQSRKIDALKCLLKDVLDDVSYADTQDFLNGLFKEKNVFMKKMNENLISNAALQWELRENTFRKFQSFFSFKKNCRPFIFRHGDYGSDDPIFDDKGDVDVNLVDESSFDEAREDQARGLRAPDAEPECGDDLKMLDSAELKKASKLSKLQNPQEADPDAIHKVKSKLFIDPTLRITDFFQPIAKKFKVVEGVPESMITVVENSVSGNSVSRSPEAVEGLTEV